MLISVVFLTYRPGGYDLLVDGLKNQTHQNYELICVDEVVERQDEVIRYITEHGVHISHVVPSKAKCFPELPHNLINAYNTGVLLSKGDIVIILNDYAWLQPNCLQKFAEREDMFKDRTCISGIGKMYDIREPDNWGGTTSVWNKPWRGTPEENGCYWRFTWVPEVFELFYSAFSYGFLQEINGFRECYDYHRANQINPLIEQVKKVGGNFYVDTTNVCHMLLHQKWGGPLWHQGSKEGEGKLVERENCFDLRTHVRGTLP